MWFLNIIRHLLASNSSTRMKRMAFFNIVALLYYFCMNSMGTYLTIFRLIPYLFANDSTLYWTHLCFSLFILLNAVGNTYLVIKTDCSLASIRRTKESTPQNKWTFKCDKCQESIPPRCHHCPMCDSCILKRDHHCFFLGICVGLQNEKYFILLTQYLMIGTFYTCILLAMYLNRVYSVQFHGVITACLLLPKSLFAFFLEHTISIDQMMLVAMFYGSFTAGLSNAGLFLWHFILAVNGQTSYEITVGIDRYCGKSYWRNFTDVFGSYWFISYLLPIGISSPNHAAVSQSSTKRFLKQKLRKH